ncbi:MAG: UDP-2,3-diacylglucosamine diphosphatase [Pseudohongiellaceae bacterium]
MIRQLFISDLHLDQSRPDITAALDEFLSHNLGKVDQLYILGDLFEAWIGDDNPSELSDAVAQSLHLFASAGAELFFAHGNRDFLLGDVYAGRCKAQILPEQTVIETAIGPLLIMHGDSLCVDDTDYQDFRRMVRTLQWQQQFLDQPLAQRQAFAEQARAQSAAATAGKKNEIMDVNALAVSQNLEKAKATTMLHGHTHRPAIHELDNSGGKRIVLGDWDKLGWYASIDSTGLKLESFEFGSLAKTSP